MKLVLHKKENLNYTPENMSGELVLKKYVQSFLKWIVSQNRDFDTNLTSEELGNYFYQNINHPIWYQEYLKKDTFNKMVKINKYIEKYKNYNSASKYSYYYNISPKQFGNYEEIKLVEKPILEIQKTVLLKKGYSISDVKMLSKEEADFLILKGENNEKTNN